MYQFPELKFSTEAEWWTIAQGLDVKWQFPHCLGALHGKNTLHMTSGYMGWPSPQLRGGGLQLMMAVTDEKKMIHLCKHRSLG